MRNVWAGILWLLSLLPLTWGQGVDSSDRTVVFPHRIDVHGDKYAGRHFQRRSVRGEWDDTEEVRYRVELKGKQFQFNLRVANEFVLPGLVVQRYSDNNTWLEEESTNGSHHCFYSGNVNGEEGSQVIISVCDGLTGMFTVGSEKFLIEPHVASRTNYSNDVEPEMDFNSDVSVIPHLIYSLKHSMTHSRNGNESLCGVKEENYKHRRRKKSAEDSIEELNLASNSFSNTFSSHHVHKRSVSMKNYVEVMVAADYRMAAYHGDSIQHYILILMSIVHSIFRNHTIANFIQVVVVKIIIFHSDREGPRITANAHESLDEFCNWQYQKYYSDENSPHQYDTAILITRQNICSAKNKCDTLGLAELGTMCDPNRSCSIIEDNGISAAYTIAHELGHVFNLPHDDDEKRCSRPFYTRALNEKTHVMAPTIDENTDPWSWSSCSSKILTKFLDAGLGHCLRNVPRVKRYRKRMKKMQRLLPGHVYKADKQCEMVYGKGYYVCDMRCDILLCTNDTVNGCRTQHMPMADGTECGAGRVCLRGTCTKHGHEKMVHGGWSKWSKYGRCTRTCGGGIKRASRDCSNPQPRNGGRYCTGKRIKYRHCNIKPCPPHSSDFRVEQCAEYNSQMRYYNVTPGSRWLPKYDGIKEKDWCKLYCSVDKSPSHFYMLKYRVIDGTKCRPDGDDICVNGQCRRAGCDNKLGSNMKRDFCGVCGGDNASCKTFSGVYNTARYGYHNVSTIPIGATNIDIRQPSFNKNMSDDENYLVLTNKDGEYLLNGGFLITTVSMEIKIPGSRLWYSGSDAPLEWINATGPLYEELSLQVLSVGSMNPLKIQYSYTMSLKNNINFVWEEDTEWSECDSICNGEQFRRMKCVRELDRSAVSSRRCENQPQPQTRTRRCNQYCKISWHASQYECSAQCGPGEAKQDVACVLQNHHQSIPINEEHCRKKEDEIGQRPVERVRCYGKCLETSWKYSDWSQCTSSCNGGAQKRTAVCVDVRENVVPNRLCNEKELNLKRTCNTEPCAVWRTQDWNGCTVTCGSGSRHRKVTCYQGNKEVGDELCENSASPTSKLPCYMGPCPAWSEGEWGPCSTSCNKGVSRRTVECQSTSGQELDDIRCDATLRPYETRPCNLGNCLTTANPTTHHTTIKVQRVEWSTGSWSQCSASCGEGFKQRYVKCMDTSGTVYNSGDCNHLTKPTERETCLQRACGYWRTGEWDECSVTCGAGTQTRYVACQLLDRQPADDVMCDMDIKPDVAQACNPGECIPVEQYDIGIITRNTVVGISHWTVGPWGGCSSSCGTGWQRRQVLCRDENGPNTSCDESQKPETRQTCDSGPCPAWVHGDWSECSVSCGDNGIQKRVVLCQSGNGHPLSDWACDVSERPPDSRMCNNGPCNQNRSWQVGPWSPCSVTCGRGQCQRDVLCVAESGDIQSSSECQGKKPRNTKHCKLTNCPSWVTGQWSRCSVSCGEGTRHRKVQCRLGYGDEVPKNLCAGKRQPRSEIKCERKKCSDYTWRFTEWSKCTKACGFGSKTRTVFCVDRADNTVENELCDPDIQPKHKRRCSEFPCPFMWNTGPWSQCSVSCGEGQQTRRAACQAVTKEGWIMTGEVSYGCKTSEKPAEIRFCNYGLCNATNRWVTAPWGECSARCGKGLERRQVQCLDLHGQRKPKRLCSKPHKPATKRHCYNGPCFATSCKLLKEQTSIRQDNNYKLSINGRLIEVYCKSMKKTMPEEFIMLPAGETENFSEVYPYRLKRPGTCPNNGTRQERCTRCRHQPYRNKGFTSYSMIKIDIITLKVIASDMTFALTEKGKNIPFGSAGDCYSAKECPQGKFRINLSGTGLVVAQNTTWVTDGQHTSHRITRKQDGEIVEGVCGGLCGWCSPDSSTGLQLDLLP